jgi:hypothetical protein
MELQNTTERSYIYHWKNICKTNCGKRDNFCKRKDCCIEIYPLKNNTITKMLLHDEFWKYGTLSDP